jgi:hypothetical protein
MNQLELQRLTERERKTYAEGMAIVKRKLDAGRQTSANPAATYKFLSVSYGRAQNARRLAAID